MSTIKHIAVAVLAISVCSCGIFKKYESKESVPETAFGKDAETANLTEKESIGELSWREIFSEPELQELIDSALIRNTNLAIAQKQVEQADAILKSAKLGYLPNISFNPSFNTLPEMGYKAPIGIDWGVDGFGSITNRKREASVLALQAVDNELTVKSQLIASVAEAYYHLQLLDRQHEILKQTVKVWENVLETMKALMENGKYYSTSVNHMKADLLSAQLQEMDIVNEIKDIEGVLCMLLCQTPQRIDRKLWTDFRIPDRMGTGVPAKLLENRADVRAAGRAVEAAYYVTNQARCAMLPSLDLTGLVGWASKGQMLTNPGELIYNAVLSLAQPIFAQGRLRANLKVAKLQQEQTAKAYTQKILEAGNEVNVALRDCKLAKDKGKIMRERVDVLQNSFDATTELMRNGKATYIEVLISQETLLEAQLSEAENLYYGTSSFVSLYVALGGGIK